LRRRIAILISVAIAISYLDRQTLPVAIQAIGKDIPLSNGQFSSLQSAFLIAYASMYAGGGKLADVLGTRRGFFLTNTVGAVAGLVGFGGAMAGIAFGELVGYLLDYGFG
jgi:MFS transporter, ACS family, hexuronate transporter